MVKRKMNAGFWDGKESWNIKNTWAFSILCRFSPELTNISTKPSSNRNYFMFCTIFWCVIKSENRRRITKKIHDCNRNFHSFFCSLSIQLLSFCCSNSTAHIVLIFHDILLATAVATKYRVSCIDCEHRMMWSPHERFNDFHHFMILIKLP